jgi:hypothetical protein
MINLKHLFPEELIAAQRIIDRTLKIKTAIDSLEGFTPSSPLTIELYATIESMIRSGIDVRAICLNPETLKRIWPNIEQPILMGEPRWLGSSDINVSVYNYKANSICGINIDTGVYKEVILLL